MPSRWMGKRRGVVVHDSLKDPFAHGWLFEKNKGKPNITFIGLTKDGDAIGGFYGVAVTAQDNELINPNHFIFSSESHGRCVTAAVCCEGRLEGSGIRLVLHELQTRVCPVLGVWWVQAREREFKLVVPWSVIWV